MKKDNIERLLIKVLYVELNNNGDSLEEILCGMNLDSEEESYIRTLMKWDEE